MPSFGIDYEDGGVVVNKNSIVVHLYADMIEEDDYEEDFIDVELRNGQGATSSYNIKSSGNYYTITATISNFPRGVEYDFQFRLNYEYREKDIDEVEYGVETVEEDGEYAYYYDTKSKAAAAYKEFKNDDSIKSVHPTRQEYENGDTSSWVGEDWTDVLSYNGAYMYELAYYRWGSWKDDYLNLDTISVYTHPDTFHFKSDGTPPAPNDRWNVTQGLKTLFTNFEYFNGAATAKKRWEKQSGVGECSAFPDTGVLSAQNLNDAYEYLDIDQDKKFQSGQIIAASMFSALEDAINN